MVLYDDIFALNNSVDFLKIYDGKRTYYGGTQSWFKNCALRKVGCSIVAAANITAYIAKKMKNEILYDYGNMSKENFLDHMESIAEFIHPDVEKGVISASYFAIEVIRFAMDRGVNMQAHMITTEDNFDNIRLFVEEGLSKDQPIALLMLKNDILKDFDWHWMTVTKLFKNIDKSYVHFSTWGERRIFTLEDFYKYSSFGALTYFEII
ncbi:MAG: hypothetical protein E7207_00455 [Clostridium butyricum]|nr:hypothetical protein [Clostridium butyricum]